MLHAYFDESGTNAGAPVLSVAGYYGTKEQWGKFESLWLPVIPDRVFHAKNSCHLFPSLAEAMEKSGVEGVLCTIDKDTFNSFASPQFRSTLGNAYAASTFSCAIAVCDAAQEKGIGKVSFILEQGQPNLRFVKEVLESMLDTGDTRVASVSSANKNDFVELHTADFASHVASSYKRAWLEKLVERCNLKHCHHKPETFIEVSDVIKRLISRAREARRAVRKKK